MNHLDSRRLVYFVFLLVSLLGLGVPAVSRAGAASPPADLHLRITQQTLYPGEYEPGSIVDGGGGSAWFAINTASVSKENAYVNKIGASGGFLSVPVGHTVEDLAHGPDGIWFVAHGLVGRINPAGEVRRFPVETGEDFLSIAFGAGGYLWLTKRDERGRSAIQRISVDGAVKSFPLPHADSAPEFIVRGADGAMWFTEPFGERIGRITSSGKITEYPLGFQPAGEIAIGPEGDIWFGTFGGISRLSPTTGKVRTFWRRGAGKGPLIAGPDGRIWFSMGFNTIGRVTPEGHFSKISLPGPRKRVSGLAVASDGSVLYTASSRPAPGVVGRITLGASH